MTDETKKLLDAPWKLYEYRDDYDHWFQVLTNGGRLIASRIVNKEDYNRLAHLPELYDALVETVYLKCFECMGGLRHNIDLTQKDLIENGCPKQNKSNVCIYAKHIELLRKVRDGK